MEVPEVDEFEGKVALVTGGSKGIGRAIALRLAGRGAAVAITWFRDRVSAEKTLGELQEIGARALDIKVHLGDPDAPAGVVEEIRGALGEPDLLVSNAASGVQRTLDGATANHWEWTMATNAQAFLHLMQASPKLSSVVALTSLGAERVMPLYGVVGASKAALGSLVRYFAAERAPGCRVNAVSAGVVDTDSLRRFPDSEEILETARSNTPMGRLVGPEDVADAAVFLLSEDAAMITGQTLTVDGGYALKA
jgi:enoyl-[acyl-carrier protein] reductase III